MGTYKRTEGQTIIETALMLCLLLLILFGITEFSRAWFTKNSLKNAVRHGARIAVVTDDITDVSPALTCPQPGDAVINAVCTSFCTSSSPAECYSRTTVSIDVVEKGAGVSADPGDTITVSGSTTFNFVIGGYRFTFLGLRIWPWPNSMTMTTDASMRYE